MSPELRQWLAACRAQLVANTSRQSSWQLRQEDIQAAARLPLQVACGGRHTLVRCASGAVYATGWNRYGQCCCCCSGAHREPSSCGAASAEGLSQAWCCGHGEAIYRPIRVHLSQPPDLSQQHQEQQQQQVEEEGQEGGAGASPEDREAAYAVAAAVSPRPRRPEKLRRLGSVDECGASDGGADGGVTEANILRAVSVFAGPWHSVVCVV